MDDNELRELIDWLRVQPHECEWLEFKKDFHGSKELGEDISSLSNSATLHQKEFAYIVFGIMDKTHDVIGCKLKPSTEKVGGNELTNWLSQMLEPKIDYRSYAFEYKGYPICLFKIPACIGRPVRFKNQAYIRVGSNTRLLNGFPEKEKKLWNDSRQEQPFEDGIALEGLTAISVLEKLNTDLLYELRSELMPTRTDLILKRCEEENLIVNYDGQYAITNLGGLVFGNSLKEFPTLQRRAIRVVKYAENNRHVIAAQHIGVMGYAVGFSGLLDYINKQIPENEIVDKFRRKVIMYPQIAIRELVANAMFHQDFFEPGVGPVIEIFPDRIEVTNAGLPVLPTDRFIDSNYSRNPSLSDLLQRLKICEELGSGWDKIIHAVESFKLPPTSVIKLEKQTRAILFASKQFSELSRDERIRACFQHACLKSVSQQRMTNQSLRERFGLDEEYSNLVSKVIADTIKDGLVKIYDKTNKSPRYNSYVPYWQQSVG